MNLYIINVVEGVEPEVHGPYENAAERLDAAREMFIDEDIIMRLNVDKDGVPEVESFSHNEMEGD